MKQDLKRLLNAAYGKWEPRKPNYTPSAGTDDFKITNCLPAPIAVTFVDDIRQPNIKPGSHPTEFIGPSGFIELKLWIRDLRPSDRFLVSLASSGAFITAIELCSEGTTNIIIDSKTLIPPNHIGDPPKPEKGMLIPTDSPKICVGIGFPTGNSAAPKVLITREQYWKLSSESHVLDKDESRTVSFRTQYGVQDTSTDQKMIESSLSLDVGGGWGPIQASISSSLNVSSSTTHSISVSTNTEKYESLEKSNKDGCVTLCLLWQLMDVISIFKDPAAFWKCDASIIIATQPCILRTYPMSDFVLGLN